MGIWGTIGKDLLGAIPYVGPIIQGAVEGVTANKASKQEVAGANRAQGIQDQVYQQQLARFQPFYNAGTAGLGALTDTLGLPGVQGSLGNPMPSGMSMSAMPQNGLTRNSSANYPMQMGAISDPSKNGGYAGQVPGTGTLGSPGGFANQNASGYAPTSSPIPNLKVKAPNGSIYLIPANQAADAQKNGGTVLGSA